MEQGRVNVKYEAIIPLAFYAGNGAEYIISATVDTGSEAEIVASAAIVLLLQLNYIEPIDVKQVDDEYASALLFEGEMN